MDFHSMKLFLHLSGSLHFVGTARACNISPSALSRTIQRIENELGHALFIRDNRSVQLARVGKRFKAYAQEAVDRWEHFRDSLREEEKILTGDISLYSSVTAAYTIFPELFNRFRAEYPEIHIKLQTGDPAHAIELVQDGSADVTVAARPDNLPRNLIFKTVRVTPLLFVAPVVECETTSYTNRETIPWDRVPMIVAQAALSRKRVESWFRQRGLQPNIYAEVAGHEAILSMVRLGCGVGVVPQLVLQESSLKEELRILSVDPELEPYEVGLCVHKRRLPSPVVRAFWDIAQGGSG